MRTGRVDEMQQGKLFGFLRFSSSHNIKLPSPPPPKRALTHSLEMVNMIPAALLFLSSIPRAVSLQCYHVSGNIVKDTSVVPCDPSVTGKTGSHTSCCNKGTGDQCTSTGLCLATNAKRPDDLFWINGCTDPTWRDPACPQYCNPPVNPTS